MYVYESLWTQWSVWECMGVYVSVMSVFECIRVYLSVFECIWVYMSVFECD